MKSTLALLAVTTALGALLLAPAGAARLSAIDGTTVAEATSDDADSGATILASDDDRRGEHAYRSSRSRYDDDHRRGDNDDDDDDHDDDEDDDDDGGRGAGLNPARAGTVAPPANGLFQTGDGPRVRMN